MILDGSSAICTTTFPSAVNSIMAFSFSGTGLPSASTDSHFPIMPWRRPEIGPADAAGAGVAGAATGASPAGDDPRTGRGASAGAGAAGEAVGTLDGERAGAAG